MLVCFLQANSQNIQLTQVTASSISGGLNINIRAVSGNGAGFIGYTYTIQSNIINLDVCYWFNNTLPVLFFNNDCFIPLAVQGNYTINVRLFNSISLITCDYYSTTSNQTITGEYLSASEFEKNENEIKFFPNPTAGEIKLKVSDLKINYIHLYDSFGRNVKNIAGNVENIYNLFDLKNGIYFAKIITEIGVLNKKIIVEK